MPSLLNKQQEVRVHSVFHHACNLQTSERTLLTLQSRSRPLAPRGCVLACDDLLDLFQQDARLHVRDGAIIAPHTHIALRGEHGVDTRLTIHHDGHGLGHLRQGLLQFLASEPPENGIYEMQRGRSDMFSPQVLSELGDTLKALHDHFLSQAHESADLSECLRRLVGFGIGLTPSADDFLLGVLLVMDYLRDPAREAFVAALYPLLSRTTDVSAAMLENACAGRYGVQLPKLFATPALTVTLREIADYGHSSGHDMLCGVSFALECLNDDPPRSRTR